MSSIYFNTASSKLTIKHDQSFKGLEELKTFEDRLNPNEPTKGCVIENKSLIDQNNFFFNVPRVLKFNFND